MPSEAPRSEGVARWRRPVVLLLLTFLSTFYVGAGMAGEDPFGWGLLAGWRFALPLMAILIAHEMGHYVAARIHRVDVSPPYFIPMPIFLLGTMGAVIRMRDPIDRRNALLDIGAAGPIAGMVVALPVLAIGIATSPVLPLPTEGGFFIEGRGLLYWALLYGLKGPIPEGMDIFLSPTAFAGWAGLLVTQINLIPVGQLDGGHVAYALFGHRQNAYSKRIHLALPFLGAGVSLYYTSLAYLAGERGEELFGEAMSGSHWCLWAAVLFILQRATSSDHPPTGPERLTLARRWVAAGTLLLFVVLLMPAWIRIQ